MAATAERAAAAVGGPGALPQHQIVRLLGWYLILRSLMVFPKGLPQPWDLGLALMFAGCVTPAAFRWVQKAYPAYVGFVGWVAVVSLAWALIRGTPQYLVHLAFQVFNLLLFTLVVSARLRTPRAFDRSMVRAATLGAWLQFVMVFSSEIGRAHV